MKGKTQHHSATTAAQTDLPQDGASRRYETKNWNKSKTKELPRRKSRLIRITTKNEEQAMKENVGLEVMISTDGKMEPGRH